MLSCLSLNGCLVGLSLLSVLPVLHGASARSPELFSCSFVPVPGVSKIVSVLADRDVLRRLLLLPSFQLGYEGVDEKDLNILTTVGTFPTRERVAYQLLADQRAKQSSFSSTFFFFFFGSRSCTDEEFSSREESAALKHISI